MVLSDNSETAYSLSTQLQKKDTVYLMAYKHLIENFAKIQKSLEEESLDVQFTYKTKSLSPA